MKVGKTLMFMAAVAAAGFVGLKLGQHPAALHEFGRDWAPPHALSWLPKREKPSAPAATGPVIYYRDPDGKPFYSAEPRKTADGRDWKIVRASEDVRFDEPEAAAKTMDAETTRRVRYYRNPMGLPDTSPVPKRDSMGMDYIPVFEGEDDDGATVKIALGKVQRAGVKTEEAAMRVLTRPVRAPATIALDERRVSVISLRFDAWLEAVADVTTGARVRKGERLMRVFSPEILAAAAQYRSVLGQRTAAGDTGNATVEGARRRLVNMGLPAPAIAEIERSRDVPSAIEWLAPTDGIVVERTAIEGMRAARGDTLFKLADVSVVWALVDVAERDIGAVKAGLRVVVTVRGLPGQVFAGRVDLVYPQVNMATRTVRLRVELANPDGVLLPNMFADAEIATGDNAPVLTVADSAVIDGGRRRIVIIDKGEGRFEAREVKTGIRGDGFVEIREGLAEGEKVVVAANFLIDAESNLKAALRGLEQGEQPK
jgi:Cu(I)/Ag(I) efflux system membrane fusion protein